MTVDELLKKVDTKEDLYTLLRQNKKKILKHRASSTNTFLANPLHYALATCLGVIFGGNNKTLFGTIVHEAVDYYYTNRDSRIGLSIRALVFKAIEENPKINNPLEEKELKLLIKRAIRVFKKYYREIAVDNEVLASEEYLEVKVPVQNPENEGHIIFAGTFDRLYKKDGLYILGDLKTSSMRIGAKDVEKSGELIKFELKIKQLEQQIFSLNKDIKKFFYANKNLDEIIENLENEKIKCEDAKQNGRAFKAIENKVEKLEKDKLLWESNLQTLLASKEGVRLINLQIQELKEQMTPYQEEYNKKVKESELQECIKKHYLQTCLYALMYQIEHGIRIDRARIELLVTKEKSEEIQIFEWELTDELFDKADSIYSGMIIPTLEAYLDGVEPSILFRPNPFTFFGSETIDLLEKLSA